MGFLSKDDLVVEGGRISSALRAETPLPHVDWVRALLATEIVFASNVVGSGADWQITTGDDEFD